MVIPGISEFAWLFTISDAQQVQPGSQMTYVGLDAFAQVDDKMIYAYVSQG